jgi:hypothetical protein
MISHVSSKTIENCGCIYQFLLSKLILKTKSIAYSESAHKTPSDRMFFLRKKLFLKDQTVGRPQANF